MGFRWDLVFSSLPTLLQGAKLTVQLTSIAVFFGIILGTIAGMIRLSKGPLRLAAASYIDIIRGTPLLVQTFLIFYGLPSLISRPIPAYTAAVLALSINSGAYVGEIVRAGIQSIDKGQWEAAASLGLSGSQTMGLIILPQAFRRILPPLGNEFIALLKDSSLVSVIALEELVRKGQIIIGRTFRPFEVWLAVAVIYFVMTFAVSRLVNLAEKRVAVR
ncbi:MAG: amino acid ABC transporter permease [Limnochordia bacterium]|nr:amino acid ABC transporter permease [Limnochordia bacterium]MDI9464700.1 amino acid ABC transporter permease [Bacillota bacterium]NLO94801.1 amino acid ABC transporter permease [Bacillota bacterium]HAI52380.1 nickel transporter [Bacillota bacterium]HOB39403.1 amino acid ABC transporter permease [Limnochordia bacterium]